MAAGDELSTPLTPNAGINAGSVELRSGRVALFSVIGEKKPQVQAAVHRSGVSSADGALDAAPFTSIPAFTVGDSSHVVCDVALSAPGATVTIALARYDGNGGLLGPTEEVIFQGFVGQSRTIGGQTRYPAPRYEFGVSGASYVRAAVITAVSGGGTADIYLNQE